MKTVHSSGAFFLQSWRGNNCSAQWGPSCSSAAEQSQATGRQMADEIHHGPWRGHATSSFLHLFSFADCPRRWVSGTVTLPHPPFSLLEKQLVTKCTLWMKVQLQFPVLGQMRTAERHSTTLLWCSVHCIHLRVSMSIKLLTFSFSQLVTTRINAPSQAASPWPPSMGDFSCSRPVFLHPF